MSEESNHKWLGRIYNDYDEYIGQYCVKCSQHRYFWKIADASKVGIYECPVKEKELELSSNEV